MSHPTHSIPAPRYVERLETCRRLVAERRFGALLIGVGPDLRYLTGFVGEPMERMTLLVVPDEGPVSFVVPRLEAAKAGATPLVSAGAAAVVAFKETDDVAALVAGLVHGAGHVGPARPIGLSDRLWAVHVLRLQRALIDRRFESASAVMRDLRSVKDADEARILRSAAAAADRTVHAIAAGPLVGRT
jgi:Xaa-Pro aminopeptidase